MPNVDDRPEGTIDESGYSKPTATVDYEIETESVPTMKKKYKFFQFSTLNDREEHKFNEEIEGYEVVGCSGWGPRFVVIGAKWILDMPEPEKKPVVKEKVELSGSLGEDIDEAPSKDD